MPIPMVFLVNPKRNYYEDSICSSDASDYLQKIDNMDLSGVTRTILTASHLRMNEEGFEDVCRICEIYTFRMHAISGSYKITKNQKGIIGLSNDILRNNKGLSFVRSSLCKWLAEFSTLQKLTDSLVDGTPKYYNDKHVKGWSHCYYFLYEYEIYCSPKGVKGLPWANSVNGKESTQEHILLQTHRDGSWWEAHWPDESIANEFKHRLGNLVLTNGNEFLGTKSFPEKLNSPTEYCYNHKDATNSEKRITSFTDGETWKSEQILKREIEMVQFALKRWAMPCCCDNSTITLPKAFKVFTKSKRANYKIEVNEKDCIEEDTDD